MTPVSERTAGIGTFVYIRDLYHTDNYHGSNSNMRKMIGKMYPIINFDRLGESVHLTCPRSRETYTFHCKDLSFEPPKIKREKAKKIMVSSKFNEKIDPSLFLNM